MHWCENNFEGLFFLLTINVEIFFLSLKLLCLNGRPPKIIRKKHRAKLKHIKLLKRPFREQDIRHFYVERESGSSR